MIKEGVLEDFESYAHKIMDQYQIPGVSIGINKNGERFYYQGFGFRDKEKGLPVTPDTVFGIASITKSFTCVAIMQLQESGKLSVHDKVIKYLPEFRTPDKEKTQQMTIHHFMTNSSGLPPLPSLIYANKRSLDRDPSSKDHPGLKAKDPSQEPIDTYEELMDFIGGLDFELLGPPGIHFSYSNDAFALLGAVIERVSGIPYEEYVKQHILQPAGMLNSTFDLSELTHHDDITMLYSRKLEGNKEVYPAPIWWDAPAMRAAGYLKSTVHDMLRYTEIFRNNGVVGKTSILSEDSVRQMTYPYIEIEPGKYYGYGLTITPDYYGHKLIEHGGNLKAIASLMSIIPELGITGVILTNLAGVPAGPMLRAALNDVQGKDVLASHQHFDEVELPEDELQQYVGTYQSNEGVTLTISIDEGKIKFFTQGEYHPIRCIGRHLFEVTIKDQQEIVRFIEDQDGNIDRISFHYRQFPKVKA